MTAKPARTLQSAIRSTGSPEPARAGFPDFPFMPGSKPNRPARQPARTCPFAHLPAAPAPSLEGAGAGARAAKAITTLLAARRTDKWSDQKDADMTLTFNHAPATYPVPDHDPTHPWSAGAASRLRRAIEAKTEGATP